jgi:hypothetical protein
VRQRRAHHHAIGERLRWPGATRESLAAGACPAPATSHAVGFLLPYLGWMPRTLFAWLSVGMGLLGLVSCLAAEDGPRGPVENAPGRTRTSSPATAAASASPKPPAGPQDIVAWPCGARPVHFFGDPPPHALSQSVPDRYCREDGECGDGFCDRGRCAPIWQDRYGQRCTMTCQCEPYLCLEGRCRSCLHHAECNEMGLDVCGKDGRIITPWGNDCGGLGPHESHLPPEPVRPPPPPTP